MGNQKVEKKSRAEYLKKWREKNKDKVKQHNENYWKKRDSRNSEEKE